MGEQSDSTESYSAIRSVTHGASLFLFGTIANRGLRFLISLLLTRTLGASLYGIYTYANTLTSLGSTVANLGTDEAILRFVPEYEGDRPAQNRVLGLAYLTSLVAGLFAGAVIFVAAPLITKATLGNPLLTEVLRLLAVVVAVNTLINCVVSVFRSIESPRYQVLISEFSIDIFRLVAIGVVILLGTSLVGIVAAMVVAWVLSLAFAFTVFFSRTDFSPTVKNTKGQVVEFYNFSLPVTFGQTGSLIRNRIDILMVGFFLSASTVGVYNVALLLAQFITMPLIGFSQLFPSIAARLYSNDELSELESLYARITRWSFTVSLFLAAALTVYATETLGIFGKDFTSGSQILLFFIFARLALATAGPSGNLLMMTDHQYLSAVNDWGSGILNVILNYVFIVNFGAIGAALATATTMVLLNAVTIFEVWYTEGLLPYSWTFLKPATAGVVSAGVMEGWKLYSPFADFELIVSGGVLGAAVFAFMILLLGIESEDREFFAETIASVRD